MFFAPLGLFDLMPDEATLLASKIQEQAHTLSSNCTDACNALGSMRRSVDRLCQLDPGTRCKDAKSTLVSSEEKVRANCPSCAIPQVETPATEPKPTPVPPPPPEKADPERVVAQSAPGSSRDRPQGGCLGCSTSTSSTGDFGVLALGMMWMVSRLRRRR